MPSKKGGGNRGNAGKVQSTTVPDSDYIVFGDGKKDKKRKKAETTSQPDAPDAPKPTVKQIIGGASWTGKLPVNLLSEHCQRQKWNKPGYDVRTLPGQDEADKVYRSTVTLSKTDPKTRETKTLPPMRLPADHINLSDCPSVLEAKHFAATYALFRVSSMKNIHMTLPPFYRDLWKGEFSSFKKDDVADGRAWKYDEDPFAAEVKRQEIQKDIEERKQQQQQQRESNVAHQKGVQLSLPPKDDPMTKIWNLSPKVEMGSQTRSEIEKIIMKAALWNPQNIHTSPQQQQEILAETARLGFRRSHVEEALECCKNLEEVLEWLLIYVPEDDLPQWAMPTGYNAGISLVSGDTEKQVKLQKLSRAGFPAEACATYLRRFEGDELLAARALQTMLITEIPQALLESRQLCSTWQEENLALEAIFGESYSAPNEYECIINVQSNNDLSFALRVSCVSQNYPLTEVPSVSIETDKLPAYIRLSAAKQAVLYAHKSLLGAAMIFDICQWLEVSLPNIIENPGRLSELSGLAFADDTVRGMAELRIDAESVNAQRSARTTRLPRKDRRTNAEIWALQEAKLERADQAHMLSVRQRLPAWSKKQQIISTIAKHQVTIVSGETGSGKSTQAVQFILDDAISQMRGSNVKIICTQPRRVAALSLADRVSSERCSPLGDEVGYIIRGESKISERTKITFMTTGVLLRWLQGSEGLKTALEGISHVFIDEIHERSLDTDFLLALLKECFKTYTRLKVVLMSATLDANTFVSYFNSIGQVGQVEIEGRTFPVTDLFIDDILLKVGPDGGQNAESIGKAIRNLGTGINYDLIRDLINNIDNELGDEPGSILVFLPGTLEIERCLRSLVHLPKIWGLPLHASLLPLEQRKVFQSAPRGRRKVVAATNVAETSITIEDVVAVVDTGRVKETSYEPANNMVRLQEVWASQAACKQRRGRAGRVRAGICYKLFTRSTELNMQAKPLPEIQRVPLEQLCLSVKATDKERDVADFLSKTLSPPQAKSVASAISNLHIMGALDNNQLTALGHYLSIIPADLRCAKLMVYGVLFDIIEPCLTIASILTVKSPFTNPREKREEANEARASFPIMHGDLLLGMAAYDEWTELTGKTRGRELSEWSSSKFLSQQTLRDIASTRWQLLDSLKDAGLLPATYQSAAGSAQAIQNTNHCVLLRALIAGSLQPQIASIQYPSKKYISSVSGAKELDPEAKTIKFFVPDESHTEILNEDDPASSVRQMSAGESASLNPNTIPPKKTATLPRMTRIFIHPSSILFTAQTFSHHASHLSYFGKVHTTKPFIRDLTPLNVYSLLLFGGTLEIDTSGLGLLIGGTWRIRGWARIGVLVSRLRAIMDQEMRDAVEAQYLLEAGQAVSLLGSMKDSRVVAVVRRLIELNGQDV